MKMQPKEKMMALLLKRRMNRRGNGNSEGINTGTLAQSAKSMPAISGTLPKTGQNMKSRRLAPPKM